MKKDTDQQPTHTVGPRPDESEQELTDPIIDIEEEPQEEDEEEDDESSRPSRPTLKEVIAENAREDERPMSSSLTLRKILGGDILNAEAIRRQVWLFLLIALFGVFYISNRYSCQKKQVEIDLLTRQLKTAKYKTLSLSSILTERCRESQVTELLRANNDSTIHPADQPPYIIIVNNN